jgi:DNA-binding GntR family transcriptional regulator
LPCGEAGAAQVTRQLPSRFHRSIARAAGFRFLAADLETNPAILAHRYALTLAKSRISGLSSGSSRSIALVSAPA